MWRLCALAVGLMLVTIGIGAELRGAFAADLGPIAKAPATAVPASSWTGFYAGASLGRRWSSSDWITTAVAQAFGVDGSMSPEASTAHSRF